MQPGGLSTPPSFFLLKNLTFPSSLDLNPSVQSFWVKSKLPSSASLSRVKVRASAMPESLCALTPGPLHVPSPTFLPLLTGRQCVLVLLGFSPPDVLPLPPPMAPAYSLALRPPPWSSSHGAGAVAGAQQVRRRGCSLGPLPPPSCRHSSPVTTESKRDPSPRWRFGNNNVRGCG